MRATSFESAGRSSVTLLAAVMLIACTLGGGVTLAGAASGADVVGSALEQLKTATFMPLGLRFNQRVTLKAFLGVWSFESDLEWQGDLFAVTTTGAPRFVPDTLPEDLVELAQAPSLFDLDRVDSLDAESGILVLSGPRKGYNGSGAKEATFWIDTARWLVTRAQADYKWGTLSVEQTYRTHDGYYFLKEQNARISPFGFTLEVEYGDYEIP